MSGSSCTSPFTQNLKTLTVCPAVPKVSAEDALSGAVGRLDSDNIYVNEYLLQFANELDIPLNYHRRILGGFTIGKQEPVYSACGCSDATDFTSNYVAPLWQCTDAATSAQSYIIPRAFDWYNSTNCLPLDSGLLSGGSLSLTTLNASVRVDGSSAGVLQGLSCSTIAANTIDSTLKQGCGENNTVLRPISAFHPVQTRKRSVTLWYNGKVGQLHIQIAFLVCVCVWLIRRCACTFMYVYI